MRKLKCESETGIFYPCQGALVIRGAGRMKVCAYISLGAGLVAVFPAERAMSPRRRPPWTL